MYIHQHKEWPHFIFDQPAILPALEAVHQQLGTLMKNDKETGLQNTGKEPFSAP
ncbi:MAG: DUF4172 domain-containing protein [Saprospiraceae bacterium]|nr:DUF4172 domain-containing protein [Saprospiraceae bacterium]